MGVSNVFLTKPVGVNENLGVERHQRGLNYFIIPIPVTRIDVCKPLYSYAAVCGSISILQPVLFSISERDSTLVVPMFCSRVFHTMNSGQFKKLCAYMLEPHAVTSRACTYEMCIICVYYRLVSEMSYVL